LLPLDFKELIKLAFLFLCKEVNIWSPKHVGVLASIIFVMDVFSVFVLIMLIRHSIPEILNEFVC
jgi:hypothetical protein